ncbi:DNA-directed RNA polymerases II, IV and V subunit 9B, partial [Mucuna pruriens]
NNVLFPKEDKEHNSLLHACRNCNHEEIADNNIVYRNKIHHSAQRRTQELENVAADPTLPRTKSVRCSQCNHGEAVFFQRRTIFMLMSTNQRGSRHDTHFCLLQPNLWQPLERLGLFMPCSSQGSTLGNSAYQILHSW